MTGLLGPDGKPISSRSIENKKAKPPALGERFGAWAGEEYQVMRLPGGGAIAFDTSTLTLADFRQMRQHYQINSSLSVLTFMMHQMKWHIDSPVKKQADFVEENLRVVWSRLVRAKSQALWAGFSPNVLQWENDIAGRAIVLNKIKDLIPEDCFVNWKKVTVSAPGTDGGKNVFKVYDGIKQLSSVGTIPVENSYWYPLLMENGNYYGRRLLESAFQPWFFSILLHLFANRYYERYGEPVPVGRAPYEDKIEVNGQPIWGNQLMGQIIQNLRNRSTVILPNDKTQFGDETTLSYDYTLEYLESQMRGTDFERYMTRLDEEMSLAMFTPILMMRTADVGSYNLGTQHTQVYQWMLNAISGDWADYINKYIIRPLVQYNFGVNAPPARIKFMQMGNTKSELLQAVVTEMLKQGGIKPDVQELGELSGMTFEEIEIVQDTPAPPPEEDPSKSGDGSKNQVQAIADLMKKRVRLQIERAYRRGKFDNLALGYRRRLEDALKAEGYENYERRVNDFFEVMDSNVSVWTSLGVDEFADVDQFMRVVSNTIDINLESVMR